MMAVPDKGIYHVNCRHSLKGKEVLVLKIIGKQTQEENQSGYPSEVSQYKLPWRVNNQLTKDQKLTSLFHPWHKNKIHQEILWFKNFMGQKDLPLSFYPTDKQCIRISYK